MTQAEEKEVFLSPEVDEKLERARKALDKSEFGKQLRQRWLES